VAAVGDAHRAAHAEAALGEVQPLRVTRPTPSNGSHLMNSVSTPLQNEILEQPAHVVVRERGADAVLRPKQRRRPRATLYSPPPPGLEFPRRAHAPSPDRAGA